MSPLGVAVGALVAILVIAFLRLVYEAQIEARWERALAEWNDDHYDGDGCETRWMYDPVAAFAQVIPYATEDEMAMIAGNEFGSEARTILGMTDEEFYQNLTDRELETVRDCGF